MARSYLKLMPSRIKHLVGNTDPVIHTFYKANGVRPFDEVVLLQMNMLETPAMADRYYLLV